MKTLVRTISLNAVVLSDDAMKKVIDILKAENKEYQTQFSKMYTDKDLLNMGVNTHFAISHNNKVVMTITRTFNYWKVNDMGAGVISFFCDGMFFDSKTFNDKVITPMLRHSFIVGGE